ncbi:hypothetical protein CSKR_108204 [Clonorchis sinensis]|uniref:Uncharacterized protein n=1 Tax=Clonorchis sinensis TaxID=79923 RepID=A0A419PRL6_CLOSI|nr:hypothetical protein CSKR_108204 [Clonorchis sinensis]
MISVCLLLYLPYILVLNLCMYISAHPRSFLDNGEYVHGHMKWEESSKARPRVDFVFIDFIAGLSHFIDFEYHKSRKSFSCSTFLKPNCHAIRGSTRAGVLPGCPSSSKRVVVWIVAILLEGIRFFHRCISTISPFITILGSTKLSNPVSFVDPTYGQAATQFSPSSHFTGFRTLRDRLKMSLAAWIAPLSGYLCSVGHSPSHLLIINGLCLVVLFRFCAEGAHISVYYGEEATVCRNLALWTAS